jgi:hypothetical protein
LLIHLGFVLRPLLRTRFLFLTLTPACSCVYICKFSVSPYSPPPLGDYQLLMPLRTSGVPGYAAPYYNKPSPTCGQDRAWRRLVRKSARRPRVDLCPPTALVIPYSIFLSQYSWARLSGLRFHVCASPWTIKEMAHSAAGGLFFGRSHTRILPHGQSPLGTTQAIQLIVDVGYYAPAARTTLNPCVLVSIQSIRPTLNPPPHPRIRAGAFRHPAGGFSPPTDGIGVKVLNLQLIVVDDPAHEGMQGQIELALIE